MKEWQKRQRPQKKRPTSRKPSAVRPKIAKTRTEAAELLGIATRTFSEWLSLGCPGVPSTRWTDGEYDIAKIQAWRKANLNPDRNRKRDYLSDEEISTKEQIDRLKARKLEIEIAEREKRLIDIDELREIHGAIIVAPLLRLRDDVRGLPVETLVNEAIDEIIAGCERLGT